jgi:hypothetical protein
MTGLPELSVAAGESFDLASHLRREHGFTVLKINAKRAPRPPFLMAGTCVGQVKAILGIRAARVQTPYQLYRYLKRRTQHGKSVRGRTAGHTSTTTATAGTK